MKTNTRVCSADHAQSLDNGFRRLIHNPEKIFKDLVHPGQTILDLGCGPGTFTIALARMVGSKGEVIAVDVQQKMLDMLKVKAGKAGFKTIITPHLCSGNSIGITKQADFALSFYMLHEVPDQAAFFKELSQLLKPGAKFLLVEPYFHVTSADYQKEISLAEKNGLRLVENRRVFFSQAAVFERNRLV